MDEFYTPKDVENILGIDARSFRKDYTKNGFFKTVTMIDGRHYVSKAEVESIKLQNKPYDELKDFVYTDEASKLLECHSETVLRYLKRGYFPNAMRSTLYNSRWKIPLSDIEYFKTEKPNLNKGSIKTFKEKDNMKNFPEQNIVTSDNGKESSTDGYKNVNCLVSIMQIDKRTIKQKCKEGFFKSIKKVDGDFYISLKELNGLIENRDKFYSMKDYSTYEELNTIHGISSRKIHESLKNNVFPGAMKGPFGAGPWRIPNSDIEDYLKNEQFQKSQKTLKRNDKIPDCLDSEKYYSTDEVYTKYSKLSKTTLLKKLVVEKMIEDVKQVGSFYYFAKSEVDNLSLFQICNSPMNPKTMEERLDYYAEEFERLNLPITIELFKKYCYIKVENSNQRNKKDLAQRVILNNLRFMDLLDKELYLHSDTEIISLVSKDFGGNDSKKFVVGFINYVRTMSKNCIYKNTYRATTKIKNNIDKELYDKKDFDGLYLHVQNVKAHLKKAINDRGYAEAWFYVMMNFINAWRLQDILSFPNVDLKIIQELDFDTIENNPLTDVQSQEIINLVKEIIILRVHKTGALNKFLVNEGMLIPAATVILILGIHNKETDLKYLFKSISDSKTRRKWVDEFLGKEFEHINFSNRTANRTLLTYFHYNVVRSSKNADVAHVLASRVRKHKSEDSIQQYVMSLNSNDNFDDVTVQIFKRGNFGWLFHSLLDIATNTKENGLTTEEKTSIIEKYQELYSPTSAEKISEFFLTQQSSLKSVALEIASIPTGDLLSKLDSIFNGFMPSREDECQCLYSKDCKTKKTKCKTCNFLIPKIYMLTSLKDELESILGEIENVEEYKVDLRIKLTSILYKLLNVLNQAVVEFGKDYTSTFVDMDSLHLKLINLNHKVLKGN